MKTSVLTKAWPWLWRLHLVALVGWMIRALAINGNFSGDGSAVIRFDNFRFAALLVGAAIFLLVPVVGEAGFVLQRPISTRSFWRALFVILAFLWVAGIALSVAVGLYVQPTGFPVPNLSDWIDWVLGAGNLWALWLYAYRSDHLWIAASSSSEPGT